MNILSNLLGLPEMQDLLSKVDESQREAAQQNLEELGQMFRKELQPLNESLNYTSANGEPAKHQDLSAKRDQLFAAYQSTLSKLLGDGMSGIPAAAGKIAKATEQVANQAVSYQREVAQAKQDWLEQQPAYETMCGQVDELETWGNEKAGALRKILGKIQEQVDERTFSPALKALESLAGKLPTLYEQAKQTVEENGKAGEQGGGDPAAREGLTLLVKDAKTGEAVEGVAVTVGDQSDTTSGLGLATVELPVGSHAYKTSAEGFAEASGKVEIIAGDNPELVIELKPSEQREGFTILVRDAKTQLGIKGVSVTVGDQTDSTSSNGLATVELPVGSHEYQATMEGYKGQEGKVEIIKGDNPELVLDLEADEECKHASVSVIVTDAATSKPVQGATVAMGGKTEKTSASGVLVLTLEPGTFDYTISAAGYETMTGKIDLTAGDNNELAVDMAADSKRAPQETPPEKCPPQEGPDGGDGGGKTPDGGSGARGVKVEGEVSGTYSEVTTQRGQDTVTEKVGDGRLAGKAGVYHDPKTGETIVGAGAEGHATGYSLKREGKGPVTGELKVAHVEAEAKGGVHYDPSTGEKLAGARVSGKAVLAELDADTPVGKVTGAIGKAEGSATVGYHYDPEKKTEFAGVKANAALSVAEGKIEGKHGKLEGKVLSAGAESKTGVEYNEKTGKLFVGTTNKAEASVAEASGELKTADESVKLVGEAQFLKAEASADANAVIDKYGIDLSGKLGAEANIYKVGVGGEVRLTPKALIDNTLGQALNFETPDFLDFGPVIGAKVSEGKGVGGTVEGGMRLGVDEINVRGGGFIELGEGVGLDLKGGMRLGPLKSVVDNWDEIQQGMSDAKNWADQQYEEAMKQAGEKYDQVTDWAGDKASEVQKETQKWVEEQKRGLEEQLEQTRKTLQEKAAEAERLANEKKQQIEQKVEQGKDWVEQKKQEVEAKVAEAQRLLNEKAEQAERLAQEKKQAVEAKLQEAQDWASQKKDQAGAKVDEARAWAQEKADQVEEQYESVKESAREAASTATKAANDAKDWVENKAAETWNTLFGD